MRGSLAKAFNLPPSFSFEPNGLKFTMPMASLSTVQKRTATVGQPFTVDLYTWDDAKYSSGTNAPMKNPMSVLLTQVPTQEPLDLQ